MKEEAIDRIEWRTGFGRGCGRIVKQTAEGILLENPTNAFITLANDQLDAQFFYFIICLLQSSTCFEQRRAHHQEVKLY